MKTKLLLLIITVLFTQISAAENLICMSDSSNQVLTIDPSSKTVKWGKNLLATNRVKLTNFNIRRCPICYSGKGTLARNGKTHKISFNTRSQKGSEINGFKQIARVWVSVSGFGSTTLKCIDAD